MPTVHHQHVLVLPRPRLRSCRRPLHASPASGRYSLPRPVLDRLQATLAPAKNRESALTLAVFVARFWSAPGRLGLPFPADRRALCGHREMPLTEARIRGAIKLLEEVGFLERIVSESGQRYQRTADGLHRQPLAFHFGAEFEALFVAANRTPRSGSQKAQDGRRPLPAPQPAGNREQRPWALQRPQIKSPKNTSQVSALLLMGEVVKGLPEKGLDPKGAFDQNQPLSRLEAALQRLGEALGVRRDLERGE